MIQEGLLERRLTIKKTILFVYICCIALFISGCEQFGPEPTDEQVNSAINTFLPGVKVSSVKSTAIMGIYEVALDDNGRAGIVYINNDGTYILTGSLLDVQNMKDLTSARILEITSVDFNSIPLTNSITLGAPDGQYKAVVFTDPDCKPCALYHAELRSAVKMRNDLTIYLKPLPQPNNYPYSYKKARAIACAKDNAESLKRLEEYFINNNASFDECQTNTVEETMKLAARLKVKRSPTTIFTSGVKFSEAMMVNDFLKQLDAHSSNKPAQHGAEKD